MKTKITLTKKDCVVVFVCAVFLLMCMGAVGTGSRERARRILCKTNLYQWGVAFKNHKDDNGGQYLSAFGYTDGTGSGVIENVVPNELWFEIANTTGMSNYDHPGQFSHEAMAPYMPSGFNPEGLTRAQAGALQPTDPQAQGLVLTDGWTCPSFRAWEPGIIQDNLARIQQRGFLRGRYSCYGRSDLWVNGSGNLVTNPEDFGGNQPGSEHLVMTDTLYAWQIWLDYNHSIRDKRDQIEVMTFGVEPDVAGINKLFGDGHVIWKDRSEYQGPGADPTLIDLTNGQGRRVSSISNQAVNWY